MADSEGRESLRTRIRDLEAEGRALDPDRPERERLAASTNAYVQRLLDELPDRPAYLIDKTASAAMRELGIGNETHAIETLLERFDDSVVRPGLFPAHGGHMGYIPGGGIFASSLGDYVAAVCNEYSGVSFSGPGAVEMENQVLAWMAGLVGYPPTAAGNLTSGGSIASLISVVTAREAAGLRARDYERAVVYSTSHAHHCLRKALRVAGLGEAVVREIQLDERFRMEPSALESAIRADREAGLEPWLVLASAGTTDVGAIDPLPEIADIAEREGLWYHVDAAYGGFFALVEACRDRLAGLERANSVVLDPHKGMFLPYGSGAVLIRDGDAMHAAHTYAANYMQDTVGAENEARAPAALSPELTRHFRGVRVWLPLLLHGVEPFRANLEEKLALAEYFYAEVAALGFEVGPRPDLTVVTYRWVPDEGDANAFNRALIDAVHRDGRVFVSSTMIDGRFVLRMAALAFRTHLDTVDLLLEVLKTNVASLLADPTWTTTASAFESTAETP